MGGCETGRAGEAEFEAPPATLPSFRRILEAPGGEERQFYGTVLFKDNDRWRGQIKDGYRTASGRIRSYFSFNNKGTHHLRVSQATSQYDLEGIHSLRLTVTKAPVDYDL